MSWLQGWFSASTPFCDIRKCVTHFFLIVNNHSWHFNELCCGRDATNNVRNLVAGKQNALTAISEIIRTGRREDSESARTSSTGQSADASTHIHLRPSNARLYHIPTGVRYQSRMPLSFSAVHTAGYFVNTPPAGRPVEPASTRLEGTLPARRAVITGGSH